METFEFKCTVWVRGETREDALKEYMTKWTITLVWITTLWLWRVMRENLLKESANDFAKSRVTRGL